MRDEDVVEVVVEEEAVTKDVMIKADASNTQHKNH